MGDSLAIIGAFKTLKEAMEDDPSTPGSYAHSWHSEIVTAVSEATQNWADVDYVVGIRIGEEAASAFMKEIFGVDMSGVGKDEDHSPHSD